MVTNRNYKTKAKTYPEYYKEQQEKHEDVDLEIENKKDLNKKRDKEKYRRYKKVLKGNEYLPKTFEEFQELKYNESSKYEPLKREYKTINSINKTKWSDDFKSKCTSTYYKYRKEDIEVSKHFLQNYNKRLTDFKLSDEDILKVYKNSKINYLEVDGGENIRYTKHNDLYIRLVSNPSDTELKSLAINKEDISELKIKEGRWENE